MDGDEQHLMGNVDNEQVQSTNSNNILEAAFEFNRVFPYWRIIAAYGCRNSAYRAVRRFWNILFLRWDRVVPSQEGTFKRRSFTACSQSVHKMMRAYCENPEAIFYKSLKTVPSGLRMHDTKMQPTDRYHYRWRYENIRFEGKIVKFFPGSETDSTKMAHLKKYPRDDPTLHDSVAHETNSLLSSASEDEPDGFDNVDQHDNHDVQQDDHGGMLGYPASDKTNENAAAVDETCQLLYGNKNPDEVVADWVASRPNHSMNSCGHDDGVGCKNVSAYDIHAVKDVGKDVYIDGFYEALGVTRLSRDYYAEQHALLNAIPFDSSVDVTDVNERIQCQSQPLSISSTKADLSTVSEEDATKSPPLLQLLYQAAQTVSREFLDPLSDSVVNGNADDDDGNELQHEVSSSVVSTLYIAPGGIRYETDPDHSDIVQIKANESQVVPLLLPSEFMSEFVGSLTNEEKREFLDDGEGGTLPPTETALKNEVAIMMLGEAVGDIQYGHPRKAKMAGKTEGFYRELGGYDTADGCVLSVDSDSSYASGQSDELSDDFAIVGDGENGLGLTNDPIYKKAIQMRDKYNSNYAAATPRRVNQHTKTAAYSPSKGVKVVEKQSTREAIVETKDYKIVEEEFHTVRMTVTDKKAVNVDGMLIANGVEVVVNDQGVRYDRETVYFDGVPMLLDRATVSESNLSETFSDISISRDHAVESSKDSELSCDEI